MTGNMCCVLRVSPRPPCPKLRYKPQEIWEIHVSCGSTLDTEDTAKHEGHGEKTQRPEHLRPFWFPATRSCHTDFSFLSQEFAAEGKEIQGVSQGARPVCV